MTEADALITASCIIASRATADQVEGFMRTLDGADQAAVTAASKVIMNRLPAISDRFVVAPSLAGIPLPFTQPVEVLEPRQVLYQRLAEELIMVEDALRHARESGRGDPDAVMPLLEWRSVLAKRKQALEALLAVG